MKLALVCLLAALGTTSATAATQKATGTVVDARGLDGCTYLIRLDDGQTLEANVPAEYQVDGLPVTITYTPVDGASICMAGEMVDLKSIKKAPVKRGVGQVVDARGLDGCTYLIRLDNGKTLEADIPEDYRVNGLRVAVTYLPAPGMSICMAGEIVKLTSIGRAE